MEKKYYDRKIETALLIIALGLLFAIGCLLVKQHEARKEESQNVYAVNIDSRSISEIELRYNSELCLHKSENGWLCTNTEISVDQDYVDGLCDKISSIQAYRTLSNSPEYHDVFMLDEPVCTLYITQGKDENFIQLVIGAFNSSVNAYYVCNKSDPQIVYLVKKSNVEPLLIGIPDIVAGIDELMPKAYQLFEIDVSNRDGSYSIINTEKLSEKLYSDHYKWAIAGIYQKPVPAYGNRISSFISKLASLSSCTRVSYMPSDDLITEYGIGDGYNVTLAYISSGLNNSIQLLFSEPDSNGDVYFTVNPAELIYRIDSDDYKVLSKYFNGYYVLTDKLCDFNIGELSQVSINGKSGKINIYIEDIGNEVRYSADGTDCDEEKAAQLLDYLCSIKSEGYLQPNSITMPDHIADYLEIAFTNKLGDITTLYLSMFDANFYIAEIESIDTALVSKTTVSQIKEMVNSLCG